MIEIKVICDGCGEVINTRKTLQDLREFIDDSDYYINNALTGGTYYKSIFYAKYDN